MIKTILLVEDDLGITNLLCPLLEQHHYKVEWASTLKQAVSKSQSNPPDLVLLDLGLPDGNGRDFLGEFRKWSTAPVLVLSALGQEQNKVAMLDQGADDFLDKPFGSAELLARIRALLRRAKPENSQEIAFGNVQVNLQLGMIHKEGQAIHLTKIELKLLELLLETPGKVLGHQYLLTQIWGPTHSLDTHYLRIYIKNLRQKLEVDPINPRHLLTELGIGYRFVIE